MNDEMLWIPAGQFRIGSDDHDPEEAPVCSVAVDGFWIDRCQTTNGRFSEFVQDGRDDEPVVLVAYEDAAAFATWAGNSLPTEAEWERAARGGLEGAALVGGDEPEQPDGPRMANYWHGDFPWRSQEGYGARSPVASYPPNAFGLYAMAGNVWEWTSDWYAPVGTRAAAPCVVSLSIRPAGAARRALTLLNRSSRFRGRRSRAAPTSVQTATACATGRPHVVPR